MDDTKVYAGNLSYDTDESSLQEAFSKYGNVVDCKVITDRETGRSRGFGFITFDCKESATDAVDKGPLELDGRGLKISFAQARGGGGGGRGRGFRGGGGYQYPKQQQQRDNYGYGGGNRGGDGYGRQDGGW
ncbi:glycine-rich RNA-binding protein 10-like [Pecten maximus]|uniref:glycine-rich RNA-binding protein 10-like n=1 Tax=Pecten maximus TaxID=6579 RepID=UPI001458BCDD|nr:glycine-rich RNA-binding protein 10-like [Pecten maximus]